MTRDTGFEYSISAFAADRLISAHDGDVALLYLYMLRTGSGETERAARDLCRTLSAMDDAEEKLRRMELIPVPPSPAAPCKPAPAEDLPEYRAEDIIDRTREDPGFSATVAEAQKVLGHVLSSSDLKRLFGIYDYLALPPEVILELLNHCVACSTGRRPSMRFIEKEAYAWANREIMSLEQAEEYIRQSKRRRDDMGRISAALGITGRALSPTEQKYIASWLDMGFDEQAISMAFDRTVTNTGGLKWSYMNTILQRWHEKNIHSAGEIEEKDPRRRGAPPRAGDTKPIDLGELAERIGKL